MGDDLHSIAFSSCNLHSSSLGWDLHKHNHLGVFNADMSQYMESSSPSADFSTGYLQDMLFEFSSKRRRLLMSDHLDNEFKSCWTANLIQNCCQDLDRNSDMKTPEEVISESYYDSSSSSQKESEWTPNKGNLHGIDPIFSSGADKKKKKRVLAKVVYPFAVVKPGGVDGDVTLNDINERILMPPTRPVRHPVGDFACRPLVSPDGPGLSGKAVVAFTRIQTPGRGTITIIRTRG